MLLKRVVSNNEIGAAVRKRRQQLSLSQEELAFRLQISSQQIQRYESGKDRLNVEKLQALSLALSVPVSFFLCHGNSEGTLPDSEHERELLSLYREIRCNEAKMLVVGLMRTLAAVGATEKGL